MNVILSGSLAYDRLMDFPGFFSEHILPEKISVLNVCFQVNGIEEKFGGTAGNIAYMLALMGEKPTISASIGRDHHQYFQWLEKHGISLANIRTIENEFTASAQIITDQANNQITTWNPGAMNYSSELEIERLDPDETIIIISPGNLEDMINYPAACKSRGIKYIFDPGQSLPMLDSNNLVQAIDGCHILICNDYEMNLIISKTGLDQHALLKKAGWIITTLGESGSRALTNREDIKIPAAKAEEVIDPTGAGDAYRGGLISGLVQGKDMETCAKMGSACASFSVECLGTQGFTFTQEEFDQRIKGLG